MASKVIVLTSEELSEFLRPIVERLEKIESSLNQSIGPRKLVFTDTEAADYLNCSTKKLQALRNSRLISFIRENGGRKILYKLEHLMEYLEKHELKRKK